LQYVMTTSTDTDKADLLHRIADNAKAAADIEAEKLHLMLIAVRQARLSFRDVADAYGTSAANVWRWVDRYAEDLVRNGSKY
jgi:hypothetical protein